MQLFHDILADIEEKKANDLRENEGKVVFDHWLVFRGTLCWVDLFTSHISFYW